MPLIFLSCLIAKVKMSCAILKSVVTVDILALFLLLGERIQYFTINYDVLCKFFTDVLLQTEEVPFYRWFAERCYLTRY